MPSTIEIERFPRTKFFAPSLRPELLERPQVLGAIDVVGGGGVLSVCAPAGFGKSSLVAQWLERGAAAQTVTWISLDPDDDNTAGFWNAVVAGLEVVLGDRVRPLADAVTSAFTDVRGVVLVPLLDLLASLNEPMTIVLDDLHLIGDERTLGSLNWVLGRLPPSVRAVLISRAPLDLPALDALRVRGAALELTAEDLRFGEEEASAFLRENLGLSISDSELEALMVAFDGWPAVLYLASLGLRRGRDVAGVIAHAAGPDALARALAGEVLRTYPPELAAFLLRLSIFERFSAESVAEVLRAPRAEEMIAELRRSNLLVHPLDADGHWLRLHHLLRNMLRGELTRTYPKLSRALRVSAGDWFRARGDLREAIGHYLAGQAWDHVAEILAQNLMPLVSEGASELVVSYLASVPAEWARTDPRLCYVGAFITAMGRDQAASQGWLSAGRACATDDAPIDGMHDWKTLETFVRTQLPFGDLGRAVSGCMQAARLFPDDSPFLPIVLWLVGKWSCLRGEWEQALSWLDRAREVLERIPNEAGEVMVPAMRALTLLATGHTEAAGAFVAQARRARAATPFANDPHSLCAVVAEARWRTEVGDASDALVLCQEGLNLTRGWSDTHFIIPCLLIERGRASAAVGDHEQAAASLREAELLLAGAVDAGVIPDWLREVRARLPSPARTALAPRWRAGEELSRRELEVLAMLSGPLSVREIAGELFVSPNTLKTHCKSLYRKLDVASREHAVARARQTGLLP